VQVDIYHRQFQVGDKFLLCTDGLCGLVDSKEIAKIVKENNSEEALKILVGIANQKGGDDNITVLIVEVLES
jgi:protein phosphatase